MFELGVQLTVELVAVVIAGGECGVGGIEAAFFHADAGGFCERGSRCLTIKLYSCYLFASGWRGP